MKRQRSSPKPQAMPEAPELVAGVGIAHEVFGGVADRQFLVLGGQHGRIFTKIGPRFMKGHMEVGGEIYPVFLMFQDPTTYGFTFTLLFRHYMAPASKVKPFLSFALGTLVSVDPIPAESSHLNFTTQLGLGVMWFHKPRLAYSLEYRVQHLSNNERGEPYGDLTGKLRLDRSEGKFTRCSSCFKTQPPTALPSRFCFATTWPPHQK